MERTETATFAAGCFWGVEAAFRKVGGVRETQAGYAGGTMMSPTYEQVGSGRTGHAESVRVQFDPEEVSYDDLLDVFFSLHDPTTPDRQGPDIGSQYRSIIFYHDEVQRQKAEASRERQERSGRWSRPVVTEIVPAKEFYPAEEYHQRYYEKRRVAG